MTEEPGPGVLEIRGATDADWPLVWPVFRATVQAGETYAFDPDMPEDVARSVWMERPPGRTVVAVVDGELLGTASFMVAPSARGRGVGRALATYVVDWHRREGYRAIQFNAVVETNTAAVALWRSLGFTVVGTVPEAFDHPEQGYVGLHVMHLPLV